MADDKFEEFRKRYESGKTKVVAIPAPLPGPGSIGRAVVGKAVQEVAKRVGSKVGSKKGAGSKKGEAASKPRKSDSGTFTSRVDAMKKRPRTQRESEVFGPLAKRKTTDVTKYERPGGPVTKYERPGGPVTKYERQGGAVTKYERPGGAVTVRPQTSNAVAKRDFARSNAARDEGGKIVGLSRSGKLLLGGAAAAGAGYAAYKSRAGDGSAQTVAGGKGDKGTVNRREGGGGFEAKRSGPQSFKDKMQGRKWDGRKTAPKAAGKTAADTGGKAKAAPAKPKFKGNWVGAAPTAMQARGGAKIKRSSFADLLKRKG